MQPITIIADENIAGVARYFAHHDNVRLLLSAGRAIPSMVTMYEPDALLIRSVTPINQATVGNAKKLQFVATATLGIDHVDSQFLAQRQIGFASAVGSSKHSVAQYVITAILTLRSQAIHQPISVGIIGLGNIGRTLADYVVDLGWQVVGFDPFLSPSTYNNADLSQVLQCDVVSIHTPLTKLGKHPTLNLINAKTLAQMPTDSLLINASRGEVVHQSDLLLDIQKTTRSVVLDVFPDEPMVDQRLLDGLAIATPHIAGYTLDGKLRGTDMVYQALCRHFNLPILAKLTDFLPNNPYHWQTLKKALQANQNCLADFYDILSDDGALRCACRDGRVTPADFDNLRKNYHLKREWLFG